MDKSFLITTGNQHQYVYSDALCYFLYVPEEMATVMEHMDASLVDRTNYYERKLKFLKEHCFFEKRGVTFQTDYSEELVKRIGSKLGIGIIRSCLQGVPIIQSSEKEKSQIITFKRRFRLFSLYAGCTPIF